MLEFSDWQSEALDYFSEDFEILEPPDENEFTKRDLQSYLNDRGIKVTVKTCGDRMAKAVRDGRATQRIWRDRGHDTLVYKWVASDQSK